MGGASERVGLSRLVRGVPVDIVVATDWLRDMSVFSAADASDGTIAGPGSRWAFVRCAHVAIANGPLVY